MHEGVYRPTLWREREERLERVRRCALAIATVGSAVLFVATAVACVATFGRGMRIGLVGRDGADSVVVAGGEILLEHDYHLPPWTKGRWRCGPIAASSLPTDVLKTYDWDWRDAPLRCCGFAVGHGKPTDAIFLPGWFVMLLGVPLPLWWYRAHRHQRIRVERKRRNECVHCGYSLHSTAHRCPECGRVPGHPLYSA